MKTRHCSIAGDSAAGGQRAFTLIEVMLALGIATIILAAIGGVFYSAIRLRDRTSAALDEAAPLHQAFALMERDFAGAIPPGSSLPLAGGFISDTSGGNQSARIQMFTTTGALSDRAPWGDIQEVFYELRDANASRNNGGGRDLMRIVSRNLLSSAAQQYDEQFVMGNVQSLQFSCYDGLNWRDSWDTTMGDTNLPLAVKIRLLVKPDENVDARQVEPYELVVPIVSLTHTNSTQSTNSTGG